MQSLVIRIFGIVQGVGFRPFVHRLAIEHELCGTVANKGSLVEVFVQAQENFKEKSTCFLQELPRRAPKRSLIMKVSHESCDLPAFSDFTIIESEKEKGDIFVSPDIAICEDCAAELMNPKDRRYLHPFINCTACGPRLSILDSMPYDRERTSMHAFPMCALCHHEYHDPQSRRYDAQPVCCNDCGPSLSLMRPDGIAITAVEELLAAFPRAKSCLEACQPPQRSLLLPIHWARAALAAGAIVAIKGIGGFHLACAADKQEAVATLRARKHRPSKPFAVMFRDLASVKGACQVSDKEEELLTGWQKPIVLLERKEQGTKLASGLAPDNPYLGVLLPYTPLHHLLFDLPDGLVMPEALVMTSGNISGAPICHTEALVLKELSGLADLVLGHNREIRVRCDDSVVMSLQDSLATLRRSRGFAPLPQVTSSAFQGSVLAIGSELKNTFCLAKDNLFYLSPHVGDLEDLRTVEALQETVKRLEELLEISPTAIACDTHPSYASRRVAEELSQSRHLPLFPCQHHRAHVLSCMAENDVFEPVLGLALDGTGDGCDGTIWGGEVLLCDLETSQRLASFEPFPHTGGDTASRQGWRIAVSVLTDLFGKNEALAIAQKLGLGRDLGLSEQELALQSLVTQRRLNTVFSTSSGRLFDAAAALLGFASASSFEGEAAMKLEFAAERALNHGDTAKIAIASALIGNRESGAKYHLPTTSLLATLTQAAIDGLSREALALRFHQALAEMLAQACVVGREELGVNTCALTGGVFQNRLLSCLVQEKLVALGLNVLTHHAVPANDGGLALGQAVYAMHKLQTA
ncbi:MAG: carbamoyltransferase HypF [Desulfovibrio sp.]|nr:carbamoyltransferase HypF [Desulfovibrio sp.]